MGMHQNINDVMKLFYYDETLLRLLYYPPTNFANIPDPLDDSLEDMLVKDEDWSIRLDRIKTSDKSTDFENEPICRMYVYLGRREPEGNNFLVADQEVVVDIICHTDFENGDFRSTRISDRVNELLCQKRVTGFGKVKYASGNPIAAPDGYCGYRHIYEFGSLKK